MCWVICRRPAIRGVVAIFAALAIASFAHFKGVLPGGPDTAAAPPVLPAPSLEGDQVRPANPAVEPLTGESPPHVTTEDSGNDRVPAKALLDSASNASAVFDELVLRARTGDTEAMSAANALISRCRDLWLSPNDPKHPRLRLEEAAKSEPTAAMSSRWLALKSEEAFCDRPIAMDEAGTLIAEFTSGIFEARSRGELVGIAAAGFAGQDESVIVEGMMWEEAPWIVESAMFAFAHSSGPLALDLEREVFRPSGISADEMRRIKEAAARWRACELGAACGPNQHVELMQCIYFGNCSLGLSVQAGIRLRELSAHQFDLMQRYLAALDARLRRGD